MAGATDHLGQREGVYPARTLGIRFDGKDPEQRSRGRQQIKTETAVRDKITMGTDSSRPERRSYRPGNSLETIAILR